VRAFRRFAFSWSHASIEEFDDAEDLLVGTVDGGAGAELQQAAGVGGDDGLRAGGLGVAHFLGEQFEGSSGMTTSQPLVGGEDADGSFVELRKSGVGDAAGEEGHAGAARTGGGKRPAEAAETREACFPHSKGLRLRNYREASGRV